MEKINHSEEIKYPKTWSTLNNILKLSKNSLNINIPNENNDNPLLIYIVTWNIHGKQPLNEHLSTLLPKNKFYHMYIIATQECMRTISASFLSSSKELWENQLKEYFGNSYDNLINSNLSAFHISVFVHSSIKNKFTNLQSGSVKTGFLNLMANKGCVAVAFEYLNKKICLIGCHLSSGEKNDDERNNDFERINHELNFTPYENNKKEININFENKTDYFDIVIWAGDFNYRIESQNKEEILKLIHESNCLKLIKNDGLHKQIKLGNIDINHFQEGEIYFLPTYKFVEESNNYDASKRNPGYTDRILYKSRFINDLKLCEYSSYMDIKYSDHKPVYAVFQLNCNNQYYLSHKNLFIKNRECNIF